MLLNDGHKMIPWQEYSCQETMRGVFEKPNGNKIKKQCTPTHDKMLKNKMNQFKCDKCDANCTVTVHNKSQHSNKKKPTECVFGIISLHTNKSISVWKRRTHREKN